MFQGPNYLLPVRMWFDTSFFLVEHRKKAVVLFDQSNQGEYFTASALDNSTKGLRGALTYCEKDRNNTVVKPVSAPDQPSISPLVRKRFDCTEMIPSAIFYGDVTRLIHDGLRHRAGGFGCLPSFENGRVISSKVKDCLSKSTYKFLTEGVKESAESDTLCIYPEPKIPVEVSKFSSKIIPTALLFGVYTNDTPVQWVKKYIRLMDILNGIINAYLAPLSSIKKGGFSLYKARRFKGLCAGSYMVEKDSVVYTGLSPYLFRSPWLTKVTIGNTELAFRISKDDKVCDKVLSEFPTSAPVEEAINSKDTEALEECTERLLVALKNIPGQYKKLTNILHQDNINVFKFLLQHKEFFSRVYQPFINKTSSNITEPEYLFRGHLKTIEEEKTYKKIFYNHKVKTA